MKKAGVFQFKAGNMEIMKKAAVFQFKAGNIFLLANGLAFSIRGIGFTKDKSITHTTSKSKC